MTNFDLIMQMSPEQFGEFLCDFVPQIQMCDKCDWCPMKEKCGNARDGFLKWLKEEVTR